MDNATQLHRNSIIKHYPHEGYSVGLYKAGDNLGFVTLNKKYWSL